MIRFVIRSAFNRKNENARNPVKTRLSSVLRAGDERIELPPKVLETPIIPFDQSPMFCFCCNYTYKRNSCQGKINKICTKSIMKRRWRDLNPRTGCPAYRISSADPSATWVHLHDILHYIGGLDKGQSFFY